MGVFATRSPYRPNPIGLSSVKLVSMENRPGLGHVLTVEGADLMDGTPIYDIKPYLSFTDSHPEAKDGFAGEKLEKNLQVAFPEELLIALPADKRRRCFPPFPRTRGPHTSRTGSSTALSFPALTCASA